MKQESCPDFLENVASKKEVESLTDRLKKRLNEIGEGVNPAQRDHKVFRKKSSLQLRSSTCASVDLPSKFCDHQEWR